MDPNKFIEIIFIKFKRFFLNLLFIQPKIWLMFNFNPLVRAQRRNPKSIPIIIINFNQLFYLKKLVNFLVARNFEKIVIVDNLSTYPPLLEYYKNLPPNVILERMDGNYGHMVFFKNKELQEKYGKGFYVVTDADNVPNENLPVDFMRQMIRHLKKNWYDITKVGFALKIDDIPDTNKAKKKILEWEEMFWRGEIKKNIYDANIDTTFSIYKPGYHTIGTQLSFLRAHRFGGDFSAIHGGWYINQENMSEEQKYYQQNSNSSASWQSNVKGEIQNAHFKKYY